MNAFVIFTVLISCLSNSVLMRRDLCKLARVQVRLFYRLRN